MDDLTILEVYKSEENEPGEHKSAPQTSVFRSLARLAIGGMLLGADELLSNLEKWQSPVRDLHSNQETTREELTAEVTTIPYKDGTTTALVRYAIIGLIFETQERLQSGSKTMGKAVHIMNGLISPIAKPFYSNRMATPLRKRYSRLVLRGQQEIDRWIETGRAEDARGRALAQNALYGSVDRSISYLTTSDEIQDLIQSQSVSLAGEVVEEVRERAVSADNFFEGVIRSMLRRPPRSDLPEPPPEIKEQAIPFRQIRGRIIRK